MAKPSEGTGLTEGKSPNMPKPPDNWTPDGLSKGQRTGAVRPTKDAYQGDRPRGSKR